MYSQDYERQTALLLRTLPIIATEERFALHGGTAINLFDRDMPRLSVDADLTYMPVEGRSESLANIDAALLRIKGGIDKALPGAQVDFKPDTSKLLIALNGVSTKLEVNRVIRGVLGTPAKLPLCQKAQTRFDAYCEMPVVPRGQLYGGKACAALDRQHPRDLFDLRRLLDGAGFSQEIKTGFLLGLASHNRPMDELIDPNLLDQRQTMEKQFKGMSEEAFSYGDFEEARAKLIAAVRDGMDDKDREFLLGLALATPRWDLYDFKQFPAVQWKLQNLRRLKAANPDKFREQAERLSRKLGA